MDIVTDCQSSTEDIHAVKVPETLKTVVAPTISGQCNERPAFSTPKKCATHKDNGLDFFCQYHDRVACEICIKISHRNCPSILQIVDVSPGIAASDEFRKIKECLENLELDYEKNVEVVANETRVMNAVFNETLTEVSDVFKRIYERDRLALEAITNTSTLIKDEIHALKTGLDGGDDIHKFLTMKKATEEVIKFKESLMSARRDARISRYGIVLHKKSNGTTSQTAKQVLGQICTFPIQLKRFAIETQSDRHHCSVSGLVLLQDGRLVVADNGNRKIKLFALATKSLVFELSMETTPLAITRVDAESVVMSSASETRGYILSVHDEIRLQRHFELEGLVQNIAYDEGQYVVSYSDIPKIDVINQNGYVTNSIETPTNHQTERDSNQPKTVSFIRSSTKAKFFLQAIFGENKITRMNIDGDVISQFEADDMNYPIDFAHGNDGSVYVCCRDSDNIFKLSTDLSVGHVILDESNGLTSPWCLAVCNDQNVLYVGSYGGKFIQVFKI